MLLSGYLCVYLCEHVNVCFHSSTEVSVGFINVCQSDF